MRRQLNQAEIPTRAARQRVGRRRGAAAAEFALVLPVFFMIVLGIIELARVFMVVHLLSDAARKGCRTAAVKGSSTADISGIISDLLTNESISGSAATITVTVNSASADASTAVSGDRIQVTVSVPASAVSVVPSSFVNVTLSGQYVMDRE